MMRSEMHLPMTRLNFLMLLIKSLLYNLSLEIFKIEELLFKIVLLKDKLILQQIKETLQTLILKYNSFNLK